MNPLLQLIDQGQAVWLDSIQRGYLLSGKLRQLIEEDGLRGETANPTIFEHALSDPAGDYEEELRELARQSLDTNAIYERIATDDVRMACDLFRPLYDQLGGADGFVRPDTINTMPLEMLAAFRDRGSVERTLDQTVAEANQTLHRFAQAGFSLETLTAQVLNEGIAEFVHSLNRLLNLIDHNKPGQTI